MLTVFFDLDGTLLDHTLSEEKAALALYDKVRPADLSPDAFSDAWHTAQERYFERYLTGAISYIDQRRARMREVVGAGLSDERVDELFAVYLAAYEQHWHIYPDVLPCLQRLAPFGLGLITNGDRQQQRRKLARLGLTDRFHPVVISDEVGCAKPNAEIFLEACRRAGCEPGASVYVGDRLDIDALGARSAGLVGIWLNRTGATAASGADHEIATLEALPAIVERMQADHGSR